LIIVTGADGQLGTVLRSELGGRATYLTREDLDLTDLPAIAPTIRSLSPDVLINCAAFTNVDGAESDEETANTVNGYAVGEMAAVCRAIGGRFVTFSTDYVFDGEKGSPYVESDEPNPINAYGRSKLLGEQLGVEAHPETLLVRTSWLFSGTHPSFVRTMLSLLSKGDVSVVDDQLGRPTSVDDLALAVVEALDLGVTGLLHLTNDGIATWYELAREMATIAGLDTERVQPCATQDYPTPAARPKNSVLESERVISLGLTPMPSYRRSLVRSVRSVGQL